MTHGDAMPSGNRQPRVTPILLRQARTLALLEFSDEEIAEALSLTLADIAQLAWNSRQFFDAITPSDEARSEYREDRRRQAATRAAGKRHRLAASPSARIRNGVSARMWAALKGRSDGALFSRLGYSLQELVDHLQGQFSPGMTMENYGRWHVDHIRPCASFDQTDPEEFAACWALSNLQPLWAADNVRKGSRTWQA
ncbi:hypothetical protein [Stenotrophomonas sp.]|uniref:hypothetical protein n=1 Tax=Stenotrophomonas sp. TaxID=69392 RepID=UPI0028B23350|nr:hypothetical protein [Stenotrophomonas sp.]